MLREAVKWKWEVVGVCLNCAWVRRRRQHAVKSSGLPMMMPTISTICYCLPPKQIEKQRKWWVPLFLAIFFSYIIYILNMFVYVALRISANFSTLECWMIFFVPLRDNILAGWVQLYARLPHPYGRLAHTHSVVAGWSGHIIFSRLWRPWRCQYREICRETSA